MTNIQITSDLHFDTCGKSLKELIRPSAKYLIIAGDLGRVENFEAYSKAVKEICGWFQKVILIPGNHEYYSSKKIPIQDINMMLKSLQNEKFVVLLNETVRIDGFLIYGSIFWSACSAETPSPSNLYLGGGPATKEQYNQMHQDCISDTKRVIDFAKSRGEKVVIVTHYAPTFNGTLAPKHAVNGHTDPKNFLYCSDNDDLVADEAVKVWVYGHTGYNGLSGKLISNQMEKGIGKPDGVLRLKY